MCTIDFWKSIYFGSIRNSAVKRQFGPCVFSALPLLTILLTGCAATLAERGLLPEVAARKPPKVQLGAELALLDEPAMFTTSFIGTDGRAHVFATDAKKQLHHIEIFGDKLLSREILGVIDNDKLAIDTVEHPPGKLRVLVGDKQYVRAAPGREWQEVKGNRCARFVPVPGSDDLFCAFVIKGEEIGAPQRKDETVVWFILVPIVFRSNKQASKIVLAQESNDGWTIRAVVDPDTLPDANSDFMVGADSRGTLHFLYTTSRGGGGFFVFGGLAPSPVGTAGAGIVATGGSTPLPELRYARVTLDQILSNLAEPPEQASSPVTTPARWLSIKGTTMPHPRFVDTDMYEHLLSRLRPLESFRVNQASGEVGGLMSHRDMSMRVVGGARKLEIDGSTKLNALWVQVGIRDGQWMPGFRIVAARGLPDSTYHPAGGLIKSDLKGNSHGLFQHQELDSSFWEYPCFTDYFLKDGPNWSAPLTVGTGSCSWHGGLSTPATIYSLSLAVSDSGSAFAAWVNKDRKFVGRWIRPQEDAVQ